MSWIESTGISGKLIEYPYKISLAIGFVLTTVIALWAFFSYLEQGKTILKKFKKPPGSADILDFHSWRVLFLQRFLQWNLTTGNSYFAFLRHLSLCTICT
jgi:hypothetical protein